MSTKKKKKATIPHAVIATEQGLEAAINKYVETSLSLLRRKAKQAQALAALQAEHAAANREEENEVLGLESGILLFCTTHRTELFPGEKKSRDFGSASVGFRLNPESLAMVLDGDKWDRVVDRLLALEWGEPFVAQKLSVDKEAFHNRKAELTPEQLAEAGLQFAKTETFFLEPKSDLLEAARKPMESEVAA